MGENIGTKCPFCETGLLLPVYELPPRNEGRKTPLPQTELRIERLACSSCYSSIEANERGLTLHEVLAPKTTAFRAVHASRQTCDTCGQRLAIRAFAPPSVAEALNIAPSVMNIGISPEYQRKYGACERCGTLAWVDYEKKTLTRG